MWIKGQNLEGQTAPEFGVNNEQDQPFLERGVIGQCVWRQKRNWRGLTIKPSRISKSILCFSRRYDLSSQWGALQLHSEWAADETRRTEWLTPTELRWPCLVAIKNKVSKILKKRNEEWKKLLLNDDQPACLLVLIYLDFFFLSYKYELNEA